MNALRASIFLIVIWYSLFIWDVNVYAAQVKTLWLGEKFSHDFVRPNPNGVVQPQQLHALRGEEQGFQVVFKAPRVNYYRLSFAPGSSLQITKHSRISRIAWTYLPESSTNMGSKAGYYEDALPPQMPLGLNMTLETKQKRSLFVKGNKYGGWIVKTRVGLKTKPGTYRARLQVRTLNGAVVGEHKMRLVIYPAWDKRGIGRNMPAPVSGLRMKAFVGYEATMYDRLFPPVDERERRKNAYKFYADHGLSPLFFTDADPTAEGNYDCTSNKQRLKSNLNQEWWTGTGHYFAARMLPSFSRGCDGPAYDMIEEAGDPLDKTDNIIETNPQDIEPAQYASNVFNTWRTLGVFTPNTYVKNPFDEPADNTPLQRQTMDQEVPRANEILHQAMPGINVMLTTWPRDSRWMKACRPNLPSVCRFFVQDLYSNRKMWDSKGSDDADTWVIPSQRAQGKVSTGAHQDFGYRAEKMYENRLKIMRKQGKDIWIYNYFTATKKMPQLTTDAPPSDAKLMFWHLALKGHQGLYVSNGFYSRQGRTGSFVNPWDQITWFDNTSEHFGRGHGWGLLFYPGYRPELGLVGIDAAPVPTLRLENMREGVEDATLINLYRQRFGQVRTEETMKNVFFPDKYRSLDSKFIAPLVWPAYQTGSRQLALDMEKARRKMLYELSRR